MADLPTLLVFVSAALVVLLVPGPGVAFVVASSAAHGRRAGLIVALGLSLGAYAHALAAASGLSLLLLASAEAFRFVKLAGAAYLIYLGIRALLDARRTEQRGTPPAPRRSRLFVDGVLVSVLNPKVALFFIAFLPQFVDPAGASVGAQMLLLGGLYSLLALVTDSGYAMLSGTLRYWWFSEPRRAYVAKLGSGLTYIGLGVGAALTEQPRR